MCEILGCSTCLVIDENMKGHRKLCEYQRCSNDPENKKVYCSEHVKQHKMVPWLATLISLLIPVHHSMHHAIVDKEEMEFEQLSVLWNICSMSTGSKKSKIH